MKTCCNGDCCQGRDCPEQREFHWEEVLNGFGYFLSGVGFVAALIAVLCLWGGRQ